MKALEIAQICEGLIKSENKSPESIDFNYIKEKVDEVVNMIPWIKAATEEEKMGACRYVHNWFGVVAISDGAAIDNEEPKPWLECVQTDWFFWERYKKLLLGEKHWKEAVVEAMDRDSHEILRRLGNPHEPTFSKKGLVIGHVQAGKTANYTALINKAVDVGYKVIIVIAGTLESLRVQTQKRLEYDMAGRTTYGKTQNAKYGVAKYAFNAKREPLLVTKSEADFNRNDANSAGVVGKTLVLVIKKNTATLTSVKNWFKEKFSPNERAQLPVLLIDDEADNASINSKDPNTESPTAINKKIRELISTDLFPKCTYVGYTATPYANIFIDPESYTVAEADDLFPRDFIYCLSSSDDYMGASLLFRPEDEAEINVYANEPYLPYVRTIPRAETSVGGVFPISHRKGFTLQELPPSMKEALLTFILAKGVRILRGDSKKHCGMLIHVSRFTDVQQTIAQLVEKTFNEYREEVNLHSCANSWKNSSLMVDFFNVWQKQYENQLDKSEVTNLPITWDNLRKLLPDAMASVNFFCLNKDTPKEKRLDYDAYPNGLTAIVVGGSSVARGITIEGLVCSYFLRNTRMYDTLMQMGRWFGYRNGYKDLCRVFMRRDTQNWFSNIALATDELRESIYRMNLSKAKPIDFGLRVRSDMTGDRLLITARNRMRAAVAVEDFISFEGRLVESHKIPYSFDRQQQSCKDLENYINLLVKLYNLPERDTQNRGWLWRNVRRDDIINYITQREELEYSTIHGKQAIINYISKNDPVFDVLLLSAQKANPAFAHRQEKSIGEITITIPYRTPETYDKDQDVIAFKKGHFFSPRDESAGLSNEQISKIKNAQKNHSSIPGYLYRNVEERNPLLLLSFALIANPASITQTNNSTNENEELSDEFLSKHYDTEVAVFGISWTGEYKKGSKNKGVPYMANQVYIRRLEEEIANERNENYEDLD